MARTRAGRLIAAFFARHPFQKTWHRDSVNPRQRRFHDVECTFVSRPPTLRGRIANSQLFLLRVARIYVVIFFFIKLFAKLPLINISFLATAFFASSDDCCKLFETLRSTVYRV